MYDEIEVINLTTQYFIFERYTTIGFGVNTLVMVPLDRSIMTEYSIPHAERLFSRSLYYVFNSRVDTSLPWYSSDAVSLVLFIIAAVMMYFGIAEGMEAWIGLMATYTAIQVVINILIKLLVAIVIQFAIRKAIEAVGPEFAIAIAVLAAAVALYGGFGNTGFGSNMCSAPLPFAEQVLAVATSLVSPGNIALSMANGVSEYYSDKIKDIDTEFEELNIRAFKDNELFNNAEQLLATSTLLSPLTIMGEEPEDYYRRTAQSGNVGVAAINGINNYVERALTLPTFAQTLYGVDASLDVEQTV